MNGKIKTFLFVLIVGGIGGILLNNLLFPALIKADFLGTAKILDLFVKPQIQTVIEKSEKTVVVEPDFWKDVVSKTEDSVVFIQGFKKGKLISQGSGIVLTSDGLIVTSLNNAPFVANTYQIFIKDKILTGKVALRNFENNLALIVVDEDNLPALDFSGDSLFLGQTNIIVGKVKRMGGVNTFAQLSFVKEILPQVFFVDTQASQELIGSALLNSSGKLIGIVQLNKKNQIFVSPPEVLNGLIDEYISIIKAEKRV